jgi:hypothetical protein
MIVSLPYNSHFVRPCTGSVRAPNDGIARLSVHCKQTENGQRVRAALVYVHTDDRRDIVYSWVPRSGGVLRG